MKKILFFVIAALLIFTFASCEKKAAITDNDIVILFTNDIHCGIEDGVTLAGVTYYKNLMKEKTDYVTLVDCGDAIQGSYLGSVSKGELLIDAMNAAGYDIAIPGNHEFDYGVDRVAELISKANAEYIACNFTYSGNGTNLLGDLKPYTIREYGSKKIAFIGVACPSTIEKSTPSFFQEDGKYVYGFMRENDGKPLCDTIQKYVDEVRSKGVDYVILLAHLGNSDEDTPYRSSDIVAGTNGIDVVLDAHSHTVFTCYFVENKDGDSVICAQTGTKLQNLGLLVISENGIITVSNIPDINKQDEKSLEEINSYISKYSEQLERVVAKSDTALSINDEDGIRAVRNRETAIGDLCADAYRAVAGTDISYVNGGGIRADLPEGDVTYADIISVHPFGNTLCAVEVTGSEILDMLEYFVMHCEPKTADLASGWAVGESGSFPNMSGIKFTVDTTIPSSVKVDENDMLVSVEGARRVSDVYVLEGEEYVPIDPEKTYTLASHNYMILNGGCGMQNVLADNNVILDNSEPDYEVLIEYIADVLNGDLSLYRDNEQRITFIR